MLLFIRVLGCTRGVFMNTFKLTQPRMLWLDQRLTSSVAFHRLKPAITIGATPVSSISLPGKNIVVPCSRYRYIHTPAGRARIITNTHGAFASSSAASSPTPAESLKAPTVPTTTVPLDDVKRILKLAQSERCRLAGNGVSLLKVCLFRDVMMMSYQKFSLFVTPAAVGFLTISSAVTMSAPFFLGKVIDTIYGSEIDTDTMTASLTSLCIMLTGVFLCGSAANAARVYLMQVSGETINWYFTG